MKGLDRDGLLAALSLTTVWTFRPQWMRPRWLYGRTWGEEHRGLRFEDRLGTDIRTSLSDRGHENVSTVGHWSELMGHAQAIRIHAERVEAAADPRGDGAAVGF